MPRHHFCLLWPVILQISSSQSEPATEERNSPQGRAIGDLTVPRQITHRTIVSEVVVVVGVEGGTVNREQSEDGGLVLLAWNLYNEPWTLSPVTKKRKTDLL